MTARNQTQLELSSFVEGDLDTIADYIAQDNPTRAVSFIREIREQILAVGQNPLLYRLRPEIGEGARMAMVGRYVILFRVIGEVARIERVVYGGRDLLALFQQK
jgi:toxin ParE1/3/4